MAMAPRATAACALAALLLALAAADSQASFFDGIFGGSDDASTDAPVVSTEGSASTSAGRSRPPKGSRSRLHIEVSASPPGHASHARRRPASRPRHPHSAPHKQLPPTNATITIVPKPPKRAQEETPDQGPAETAPSQPPAPSGEPRGSGSMYPPTVITETVRMEGDQLVAHVDVPAEAPLVASGGLRPIASLADLQPNGAADSQQSVWGPYPSELNALPFDYAGVDDLSFPYGQNSLLPWWQTRPFPAARNSWYPMSQVAYHPWRSSRIGLPPMMNPYTQTWVRARGRRQTGLPDAFEVPDAVDGGPPDPWDGYFGDAYYGYSGWPPYTPPMRMYVPPYAYPWGPVSTRWVSKPLVNNAAGQPPQPSPSPSPSHVDSHTGTGAEQQRKQSSAQHGLHHLRHSKHHLQRAPVRLQPPPWLMPQMQRPSWPSVASLPQMLPMRPHMPSASARASAPAPSASGPAPAPPPPSPPPSPPAADADDQVLYDD